MKRIIKIMPAFCVMFVALLFAGCSIEAPTVTVNGCLVSWNWVNNATTYEVEINGTSYSTTQNEYNLAPILQKDLAPVDVRIRAQTKNIFLRDSSFSASVSVSVGNTRLSAPQNVKVEITSKSYLYSWDKVDNADKYCIRLYNSEKNYEQFVTVEGTDTPSCNLYGKVDVAGEFEATVFAYSDSQSDKYAPSLYSDSQTFVMDVTLEAPDELSFRSYAGEIYCEWQTIEGASSYNVSLLNGETYTVANDSSSQIQMLELTSKGITVDKGETLFACVGSVGAENSGYTDSPYTNMRAYYNNYSSKSDYATKKYYFVGNEFDLVADSYDELQNIVWFSLYYRITNMRIFFNYDSKYKDMEADYTKCLNDYQEIKHIKYGVSPNADGSYTLNIDYLHPMYPTKTSASSSSQNTSVKPNSFATTEQVRASDFDSFGVETRIKTAKVYNSDQLYYAVQNGCKPIFPDNSNPALVVYNEAKNILRGIISDEMSDYEKVLAIFDWLCYNTHYDYDLISINSKINSGEMSGNVADYRGFYIEGVFFDQGQAVCDGMSKAFALLCGMENIDCYKVAGISQTSKNSTNNPDHAWNKVKLDLVGNDGVGEWYVVDVTQNDYSTTSGETLNHSFFLRTDEWTTQVREHKEITPNKDTAGTFFDYYDNTTYDGTNSILIQNVDELKTLAKYTKDNLDYVEFAIDTSQYSAYKYVDMTTFFGKGLRSSVNVVSTKAETYASGKVYAIYVIYYS